MEPLAGADNAGRTRANVRGSGATLVLFFRTPAGGTAETLAACRREDVPHLAIDAAAVPPAAAAARAAAFLRRHRPAVLNVAGPRASEEPGAHAYARDCLRALLREMRGRG